MDTVVLIIRILMSATGAIFVMIANLQWEELRAEVSEQLPRGERPDRVFWGSSTFFRVLELQKRLLPASPRPRRAYIFFVLGCLLFFGGIVVVGISSRLK